MNEVKAKDLMVTDLVTFSPGDDVFEALQTMVKKKISGAPVISPGGRLLGVLSEFDCINALAVDVYESLPTAPVEQYMSTHVYTVEPDTSFIKVLELFRSTRLRRLPVVSGDNLVGQISWRDVLVKVSSILKHGYKDKPGKEGGYLFISTISDRGDLGLD